ncbi:hypothetical protein IFM89_008833 [Coptis chinensis]|uniref:Uncharacterized protein n=1 Tax=Coptis chinensis TaxID=261450 RepID=A0A835HDF0_9MAGN|nr:hypothetical protein IFM89_008833 [Coptis chinensis]
MAKKPDAPKFEVNHKEPLLDISSMGSNKDLWLIQWPVNQTPDFDGQEITLKLQRNGSFASFESLSGKSYELVSFASQVPDATVFQSSASDTKVGMLLFSPSASTPHMYSSLDFSTAIVVDSVSFLENYSFPSGWTGISGRSSIGITERRACYRTKGILTKETALWVANSFQSSAANENTNDVCTNRKRDGQFVENVGIRTNNNGRALESSSSSSRSPVGTAAVAAGEFYLAEETQSRVDT